MHERAALTKAERDCCHMSQWDRFAPLAEWRAEFHALPRSELCRDCPAAQEVHNDQE